MKDRILMALLLMFMFSMGVSAQTTQLEQAFGVAERYYRLLNVVGDPNSSNERDQSVDSLYSLFHSKSYISDDEHVEQLVEMDLGDTIREDNLEHYLSQIGAFLSRDQQVMFLAAPDKARSFCYGPNNDTALVYVKKTIVVSGAFEREHDEVLTVVDGKILRVGTPAYASIFDNTVRHLMDMAEDVDAENPAVYYDKAYDYLTMMVRSGWRFHELYDNMAAYIYNTEQGLYASASFSRLNFDTLSILARASWNRTGYANAIDMGRVAYQSGIRDYDTYLSLFGHNDVHTASDGLIVFTRNDGAQGYVNLNGDTVIKPKFRQAQRFESGLAAAMRNTDRQKSKKYGLINRRGVWKLKPQYDRIYSMPDYKAYVVQQDGKYGAISYTGKAMVKPRYDQPVVFLYPDYAACCRDGKWGIVNQYGMEEVECQYDQLEITDVENGIARFRYNGTGFSDTDWKTFKEKYRRVMRHSRWSGGPLIAGNSITMNLAGAVYSLVPAVYYLSHQPAGRGGDIENEDVSKRWSIPSWSVMYADVSLTDMSDSSLLHREWDERFMTYRLGYAIAWKSHLWPVGISVNAVYEWSRWRMPENEHKVVPEHRTQALVFGGSVRYRPLNFREGGAFTPMVELGLSYVRNLSYRYKGGFFDDWGYEKKGADLCAAINHGWRWSASVGLAWGYAVFFAKYERDMYNVFNNDFSARDSSKPLVGWTSRLGISSLGLSLAF